MEQNASQGLDLESRQMVIDTVQQLRKKLLENQLKLRIARISSGERSGPSP